MYTIDILVPFDLLVDIDMGILKVIEFDYDNDIFFLPGILHATEDEQRYMLNIRDNKNPISIILVEDDQELMDDMYRQFMEKEYDQILSLACNTSLCNLAKSLQVTMDQVIRITALCENEKEASLLEYRKIPLHKIITAKPEEVNISEYDTIYIKNIDDLDRYRNVQGKNIYVANYGFNILIDPEKTMPLLPKEFMLKYRGENELSVFSVYTFDPRKLPVG